MQVDLSGRVVLVTRRQPGNWPCYCDWDGRCGRNGSRSLRQESGPSPVNCAGAGRGANVFHADLASVEDCVALIDGVLAEYGQLDVLVNNAGIGIMTPLESSVSEWQAAWDATLAVNARATALLCRLALQHFVSRGGGRIINVASRAAFRGDTADLATYAASKGAVVSLTRSIARAYGKNGVTAFVIAPGFVRTDMAQKSIDTYGESFVLDDLALNRLTEPRDLAPIITLLASGLADHATGATIDINAGSYVH